jgi:hypothetical protein
VYILLQEPGAVWSLYVLQPLRVQMNRTHRDFELTRMLDHNAYSWRLQHRVTCLTSFRMTLPRALFNLGLRLSIGMANSRDMFDVFESMSYGVPSATVWSFTGELKAPIYARQWCVCKLNDLFDVECVSEPVFTSTCIVTFACERNSIGLYVNGQLCLHAHMPVPWSARQSTFDVMDGPWYCFVSIHHKYQERILPTALEEVTLERVPTVTSEFYGHWHALLDGLASDAAGVFERPLVGGGDLVQCYVNGCCRGGSGGTGSAAGSHDVNWATGGSRAVVLLWGLSTEVLQQVIDFVGTYGALMRLCCTSKSSASMLQVCYGVLSWDASSLWCSCRRLCGAQIAESLLGQHRASSDVVFPTARSRRMEEHRHVYWSRSYVNPGQYIFCTQAVCDSVVSFDLRLPSELLGVAYEVTFGLAADTDFDTELGDVAIESIVAREEPHSPAYWFATLLVDSAGNSSATHMRFESEVGRVSVAPMAVVNMIALQRWTLCFSRRRFAVFNDGVVVGILRSFPSMQFDPLQQCRLFVSVHRRDGADLSVVPSSCSTSTVIPLQFNVAPTVLYDGFALWRSIWSHLLTNNDLEGITVGM